MEFWKSKTPKLGKKIPPEPPCAKYHVSETITYGTLSHGGSEGIKKKSSLLTWQGPVLGLRPAVKISSVGLACLREIFFPSHGLEFAWNLLGICLESAWILPGICLEFVGFRV